MINQKGAGTEPVYRTALGVTAQALRGLDLLLYETKTIDYLGTEITVPIPEAYIIHKIIINVNRNNEAKREKDRNSILAIFPHLNKEKFSSLLEKTTKKQKKAIDDFWLENPIPLPMDQKD